MTVLVRLPNGETVRVAKADLEVFEQALKGVFEEKKEPTIPEVMAVFTQTMTAIMTKHNQEMAATLMNGIKQIKLPTPEVNIPEQPEVAPVTAVVVENGSIERDRKTGMITGLRLVVEREWH